MSASVTAATDELNRALQPGIDRDWSLPAGDLEWSCRHTAAHIADDLFSYASQVIAQPEHGYLPIEAVLDPAAANHEILDAVSMCGRLLRLAVDAASARRSSLASPRNVGRCGFRRHGGASRPSSMPTTSPEDWASTGSRRTASANPS